MKPARFEDVYELSPLQQGILFHTLYDPAADVYLEQFILDLRGHLDGARFARAWQRVAARHVVLRTSFHWEGLEKPVQVVHPNAQVPVEVRDWRDVSLDARQNCLDTFLQEDRKISFDLASQPLLRVTLLRTAEDLHLCVLSFQHLVLDRWSLSLVLKEVFAAYAAGSRGEDARLSPARSYGEYIAWIQGKDRSGPEAFWRDALAGFTRPTSLRLDGRSGTPGAQGFEEASLRLSPQASTRLQSFARRQRLTLNTLVQGAWAVLASRYSGEQDVLFGTTVSGRPASLPDVESMVGLFINTLPVRVRVPESEKVIDWLRRLQEELLELRQYEYSSLVDIQGWSEVPRGTPLFESLVVFENVGGDFDSVSGDGPLKVVPVRSPGGGSNYPLTLVALPGARLFFRILADRSIFDAPSISRMLGHLVTLLEGMAADPEQPLSRLPLLTEIERRQLLYDWNQTARAYPHEKTVHGLFEEQAERSPDAEAVVFGQQRLSYRELNERANRLARFLMRRGVGPEVLVGLCVERSLEIVVGILGILKAGGAYVPLDPASPRQRLAFMLEDTAARVVLTQETLANSLPEGAQRVRLDADWAEISREGGENLPATATAENLAYVMYTSGSTGAPKGVSVRHRSVVRLVQGTIYATFGPREVFLQLAPISFDASTFEVWGALLNGARLEVMPAGPPSLEELGAALTRYGVSTLWLTAGLFQQMVDTHIGSLRGLRQLLAGGDVLSVPHVEKALRELPECRLINGYGPTENTTFTCCHTVRRDESQGTSVPIGRPIANTRVFILDRNRQPVPIGVTGELYVGGDGLARDYFGRPELTAETFVPDPFGGSPGARLYKTGDLARYRGDGEIEFLGRADRQVKIRGFRVEIGEAEDGLARHPEVRACAVAVRQEESGQKRLVGYVVARGAAPPSVSQLRGFLKNLLPDYAVPSAFVFLDALPLTPSGKVDRNALPAPEQTPPDREELFVAPRTPGEEVIAGIWAEVLGQERIGVEDDFFALGGHSLLATQIISRVREACRVEVPMRALFEVPTVAGLAREIENEKSRNAVPSTVRLVPASREGRRMKRSDLQTDRP